MVDIPMVYGSWISLDTQYIVIRCIYTDIYVYLHIYTIKKKMRVPWIPGHVEPVIHRSFA